MTKNTSVVLARRPVGNPVPEDFALQGEPLPSLVEGQALLDG
jgi:NADPH-dependent curcumin reductase CurA